MPRALTPESWTLNPTPQTPGAGLIGATVVVGGWVKTGRVADKVSAEPETLNPKP
jgi:hypothetical protein